MAIEYNNASSGNVSGETDTLTFSHTVNAGDNRILVVGCCVEVSGYPLRTVTGITFDDVALTQIATKIYVTDLNRVDLWYLLAPNVTTANVVVTWSGITDMGLCAGAITINGAKQQAPEASASANGSGTDAGVDITTLTNNAWVIDVISNSKTEYNQIADAGQTERYEDSNNQRLNGSTKPVETAGETSMGWTIETARDWGMIAASFEEAAVGGYTITIGSGSFVETGFAVNLLKGFCIAIASGSFTWTGFAATLIKATAYILKVLAGVFALTGSSVTLTQKDGDYTIPRPVETSYEGISKPSTLYEELTKPTTSYEELTKPTTTHEELTKPTTTYEES